MQYIYVVIKDEPEKMAQVMAAYLSEAEAGAHMRLLQLQTPYEMKNKIRYNVQSTIMNTIMR